MAQAILLRKATFGKSSGFLHMAFSLLFEVCGTHQSIFGWIRGKSPSLLSLEKALNK